MVGKFFKKPGSEYGESSAARSVRVPPGQRLASGFPVLTYGDTPHVDRSTWQFRVWGLAQEKTFS